MGYWSPLMSRLKPPDATWHAHDPFDVNWSFRDRTCAILHSDIKFTHWQFSVQIGDMCMLIWAYEMWPLHGNGFVELITQLEMGLNLG